jgi:hypothetical protein
MSVLEGFLGRIVVVNRNASGSLSSLFIALRGSKHLQQFVAVPLTYVQGQLDIVARLSHLCV